ncbi:hypothetical protein SB6409_00891 [Klebsiella pasteurii]|uniref:Uncharacterized protein n=1 Tax=Klebsiella pasteurii TaxID=2587529 RepID=A0A9Q9S6B4_9ENTR|nr:hypothetical protein SB6410_04764 [Klebsiella pasteurii]VUS71027.1 hypothetical protein SB6409_00891 [Klebsiella pasteurii]
MKLRRGLDPAAGRRGGLIYGVTILNQNLIEWGFMEYVDRQWKERIFSEVAGTNMTKIGKVFADLRDQLGIPYLDDYGQRRLLHSIRHSVCSSAMAG